MIPRMKIVIIGGGFNGRLLQTVVPSSRVLDWRASKPESDTRQLGPQYLWEPLAGLPFRKFSVTTLVDGHRATDDRVRRYKEKVGKEQDGGDWRAQFRPVMPGYDAMLPPDTVEYGQRIVAIDTDRRRLQMASGFVIPYDLLLSTIPLFALLGMIKVGAYEGVARLLKYRPIYFSITPMSRVQEWHPSMWMGGMRVNYLSDPACLWYRETWRDGQVFRESLEPVRDLRDMAPLVKVTPGKIYAHPHAEATVRSLETYGIHTFGRFASWRPDELAHETYTQAWAWAAKMGLTEFDL